MIENEASVKGRVIAELLSHLTNDLQIGKKIKSGELRKRLKEPAWHVPECFNMTNIDMENFSMKLLLYGGGAQCILCVCRPVQ